MRTTTTNPIRVLVLSACEDLRQALHLRAERSGYDVWAVATEDELLDQVASRSAEAVLCHVQEQGDGTLALLNRLRERHCDACLVLIGPDLGAERTAALLRAGAFDYLTNPVNTDRLKDALRQGLEVRRSFIQVRELSDKLKAANEDLSHERDSLQRWNHNLVLLNELSQAFAGTLDADEIVQMVGDRLTKILKVDVLGLLWFQPRRVWVHASGSIDEGLVEQVRQALLTADDGLGTERRRKKKSAGASEQPVHRLLVWPVETLEVPLMVAKERMGLIRLQRMQGEPFDAYQVELIKAVVTSLSLAIRNAHTHSQVQNLAMTDGLTNLLNRRAFSNILAREFKEAERYRTPLCLIMADVDHFKRINDRFGHPVGDRLLKEVAALFGQAVRSVDVVTRFGGEEFAIILPRTDAMQALVLANRIREAIERHVFTVNGSRIGLTVSMGVAQIPDPQVGTMDEFVAMADALLYQAKSSGRNRVEATRQAAPLVPDAALCAQSAPAATANVW